MMGRYFLKITVALALMFLVFTPLLAQSVDEPLPDATQEHIAREIMADIRCLVCQNQSIIDSNAGLAKDLRQIVREKVAAGQSKQDIHAFLLERYGDWILLNPPFKLSTFLLWLGPFLFLIIVGAGLFYRRRNKPSSSTAEPLAPMPVTQKQSKPFTPLTFILLGFGLVVIAIYIYILVGQPKLMHAPVGEKINATQEEFLDIHNQLEAYVDKNPTNLEAITKLADLEMRMGLFGKAANHYGQTYSQRPEDGLLPLVLQGEALVRQAQGLITPAARIVFLKIVAAQPQHPSARYYLGLWFMQNKDPEKALSIWQALKADSEEDAPWMEGLNTQIAGAQAQLSGANFAPSRTAMENVASMSDAERQAFIASMVARLRARLENAPDDYQGWWRLAKAEAQQGQIKEALEALKKAEYYAPQALKGEISGEYLELENKQNQ